MTGNITKLSGSYLMTQVSMKSSLSVTSAQNTDTSFSSFLKSDNQNNLNDAAKSAKKDLTEGSVNNSRPQVKSSENAQNKIKSAEASSSGKETKDVSEMTEEAAKDIYKQVEEITEVSDEDMAMAMEALGLTLIDLFDQTNVNALFEKLNNIEDMSVLLTDENLSTELSDLVEAVNQITDKLLDDLGMSKEEFDNALNSLTLTNNADAEDSLVADDKNVATENEDDLTGPKIIVNDYRKENEKINENDDATLTKTETVAPQKETHSEKSGNDESYAQQQGFNTPQQMETLVNEVNTSSEVGSYSDAGTEQIVRQIVDQIKINITQSVSSMQMELHPESLGHVALTIEAKAGVVTAQFTAQNEVVKEAIESQIAQLRENIEAQGVKIEAVEVTVASHEFEQNLSQEDRNTSEQEEAARRLQRAGRRLRLNLSEEIDEAELTEEEKIAKELMEENGNTVDYTA